MTMIRLTKIFHFEMAHALLGYPGDCRNIHGHSYELHVSVTSGNSGNEYIPAGGIIVDFKELKKIVNTTIIEKFDHRLVLSVQYIKKKAPAPSPENTFILDAEPTAENLLIFIQKSISAALPAGIKLAALKLYETKDSYAEWINNNV